MNYWVIYLLKPTGESVKCESLVLWFSLCSVLLFRLNMLHNTLEGMADCPRVLCCAQIVPVLLHVYFNTIKQVMSNTQI